MLIPQRCVLLRTQRRRWGTEFGRAHGLGRDERVRRTRRHDVNRGLSDFHDHKGVLVIVAAAFWVGSPVLDWSPNCPTPAINPMPTERPAPALACYLSPPPL